ncbi:hypothetical protein [Modestobacter versicolor]|uniref:Uncharacterized protein n=2 Tax=Modestobacter versicolor TaxID=429133 RepID=A0A839YD90_9ACTN|nr:hypothetical protein [Modestobacter versicolor]MBB3677713.1 hypothetical protein [Modestobacter versicolor]
MGRRRAAMAALLAFVLLTAAAIVVSGSRPGLQQGAAPVVLQVAGHLAALVGGVLLLGAARTAGVVVLGAVAVLVTVELVTWATGTGGGANIGAGLVRLVALVAVAVVTVRLAPTVLAPRRRP